MKDNKVFDGTDFGVFEWGELQGKTLTMSVNEDEYGILVMGRDENGKIYVLNVEEKTGVI